MDIGALAILPIFCAGKQFIAKNTKSAVTRHMKAFTVVTGKEDPGSLDGLLLPIMFIKLSKAM